jgi:signal peptidase I
VVVSRLVYHLRDIHRGDVIVFKNPLRQDSDNLLPAAVHWLTEGMGIGQAPDAFLVKRVIGLQGDTVRGARGAVYVNGKRLNEPYLPKNRTTKTFRPFHVPSHELFVIGDNRNHSSDSRSGLGYVPVRDVIGEVVFVMWPPSDAGPVR